MSDAALDARLAAAVAEAFGPGVSVGGTERLHGDASSRAYVRVRLEGAAPASVVAMLLPDGPRSDELGDDRPSPTLPFVDVGRYLARHGLPVPAIHLDAADRGLLLVEDVGDTTLWRAVEAAPGTAPERFAAAVDLLVRLQAAGARDPDPTCGAFGRRFDGTLARAELAHFIDHGIETRHATSLDAAVREEILAALAPLAAPFESGPTAFSHRDYMAWNLHLRPAGGELVMIDFQDALVAPDAFDLAQLLTDRTTATRLPRVARDVLVDRFEAARQAAGLPTAPGLRERLEACTAQHALKVIGRFHYLELVVGKPGYLAYLPSVYAVLRESLDRVSGGVAIAKVLAPWVPELGSPR
jgi:aminoglycoside/choline kinase family phosphotransferase